MMSASTQQGILYIVFADREMISECIYSARSIRRNSPGMPTQLITNIRLTKAERDAFDFVDFYEDATHPLKSKVKYLVHSRFKTTLFLDCDTKITGSLEPLFSSFKGYDFAMAYDNLCDWDSNPVKFLAQESNDINTGLLMYTDAGKVKDLFGEWLRLITPQDEVIMRPGIFGDQHYFNEYIRDRILKELNTLILPNTVYNVRPWCWPHLKEQGIFNKALILHAHHLHHGLLTKIRRKLFGR